MYTVHVCSRVAAVVHKATVLSFAVSWEPHVFSVEMNWSLMSRLE